MGSISKQLFFKAPLEKVWKIWTQVEKTPEWVEGVQESKITSGTKSGAGLAWNERCVFGSKIIQMDHKMVVCEDLKRTVIKTGLPMGGVMERTADFKNAPDGTTEVNVYMEWDLGMVGAFFDDDKLQHMMEKSFSATAEKWKNKAEAPWD